MINAPPNGSDLDDAVQTAFEEIVRQVPQTVDCSSSEDRTEVLIPNGVNLRALVLAVLSGR